MRAALSLALLVLAGCASSRQLVVVTTPGTGAVDGSLRMYERSGNAWRQVGAEVPVVVGRNGLAPMGEKKEGDGRSPSGRLALGPAFGFASTSDVRMPYRPLLETTECVDDTSSRFYNAIVEKGSCIFLHLWSGASHGTAGCTAMAEPDLTRLLRWLEPAAHPLLVQLTAAEYERMRGGWGLP